MTINELSIDTQNTWALLIGTGTFEDTQFPNIPAAENNLNSLRELLKNPKIVGIPERQIMLVKDQTNLYNHLDKLLRESLPQQVDTIIIYYIGHGIYKPDGLYLTAMDTLQSNFKTGLAFGDLWELTYKRAKNLLYILDCCNSGKAMDSMRKVTQKNMSILTSTLPTDNAKAPTDAPYTAFTANLLNLLAQGCGSEPTVTPSILFDGLKVLLREQGFPEPWHNDYYEEPIRFARNWAYSTIPHFQVPSRNSSVLDNLVNGINQLKFLWKKQYVLALISSIGIILLIALVLGVKSCHPNQSSEGDCSPIMDNVSVGNDLSISCD